LTTDLLARFAKILTLDGRTKSTAVVFTFRTKDRACIVRPVDDSGHFRALVMPYRMD
jgi:hypothetical protein